jgi:hypothetical protein
MVELEPARLQRIVSMNTMFHAERPKSGVDQDVRERMGSKFLKA